MHIYEPTNKEEQGSFVLELVQYYNLKYPTSIKCIVENSETLGGLRNYIAANLNILPELISFYNKCDSSLIKNVAQDKGQYKLIYSDILKEGYLIDYDILIPFKDKSLAIKKKKELENVKMTVYLIKPLDEKHVEKK